MNTPNLRPSRSRVASASLADRSAFFRFLLIVAMAAMAVFSVKSAIAEQVSDELGPAVGAVIPHDLKVETASGEATDFDALVGEKGLALFFVRSVDWCPYCRQQAIEVQKSLQAFKQRGINVAFVSYDQTAAQKRFADKWDFEPTLLSDPQIDIINAFGLRNMKHKEGSRFYGIPYPAVFIVTPARVVAAKLYEEDYAVNDASYKSRPAVDIILSAIDGVEQQ